MGIWLSPRPERGRPDVRSLGRDMTVYLLGLLWAFTYAFGMVLQQRAALRTPADQNGLRFLAQLVRNPVWLLGGFAQIVAWVIQAAALDAGSLVIVQTLQALSLVFAMQLGVTVFEESVFRGDARLSLALMGLTLALVGVVVLATGGRRRLLRPASRAGR